MRTRIWHSEWKPRWLIRCVSAALLSFMDKQEALCLDLRVRVLAAVAGGASHRPAAARFGVSAASVSRWRRRARVQGVPQRPRALGGDRRSGLIEVTIEELCRLLAERGLGFGYGTIQRFLVRHRMTRKKKTGHANEQDRPDVLIRRQAWIDSQADLDPPRTRRNSPFRSRPKISKTSAILQQCRTPDDIHDPHRHFLSVGIGQMRNLTKVATDSHSR